FLNAAVALDTSLTPDVLLATLLEVEQVLGRVRTGERYGPRTVDLDLLVMDDLVVAEPGLELPHPRLHERAFALEPLAELDPSLERRPGRFPPLQSLDASRCRRRQHPDRSRPLRGRAADRGLATRDRAHPHGRRARRPPWRPPRPRRRGRDLPLLDGPDADPRMGAPRLALGAGADPGRRAGRQDRYPDPLRRPARGRPRPDRQRGRR